MKKKLYLQFCCIIILLITWSESSAQIPFTGEFIPPPQLDPTYANIATAENVLVVYCIGSAGNGIFELINKGKNVSIFSNN